MTRRARLLTAALLATTLFTIANATVAGAGSKQPTPKQWASEVCSDITTWINSVEDTISSLKSADSIDDAASTASDGISDATQTLVDDLKDLGRPSTKNAQKAQQALEDLSDELSKDMQDIEDTLSDPGSSAVDIASTFALLGTQLQHAIDQLHAAGESLQEGGASKEIRNAFKSASSCKSLKKSL